MNSYPGWQGRTDPPYHSFWRMSWPTCRRYCILLLVFSTIVSTQFLFLRGTANELRLGKRIDRCRLVCFHLPRKLREVQSFDMRSRVKTKRGQHCQLATFHLPRRLICAQGLKLDENNLVTLLLFVHIRTS